MILDRDSSGVFVVAGSPRRGDAYNDYGCPNPPYVFLKYLEGRWQAIDLAAFPSDLVKPNLLGDTREEYVGGGYVRAEQIAEANADMQTDDYAKAVLRTPLKSVRGFGCMK